jgi:prepilin-type N-terminal cleavage/methylation domain-containing protein
MTATTHTAPVARSFRPPRGHRQRGFGLLEIIIGAAIIAVLSIAVFARANSAKTASAISQTVDDLSFIGAKVGARFQASSPGNYSELGTTLGETTGMNLARPLPDDMPVTTTPGQGGGAATTRYGNRFGGNISLRARGIDGGNNNGLGFFLTQIPKAACEDFLNTVATSFGIVDVYADATSGSPTATLRASYAATPPTKTQIRTACDGVGQFLSAELVMR